MILSRTICAWLAACMLCDLKWRKLPAWLSLPPLFGAVLWSALNGNLALSVFVLLLFILAEVPPKMRGFANSLQAAIFVLGLAASPEPFMTGLNMLALFLLWVLWKLEKMGGADAQVLMSLALLMGPAVLLPIALVGGVQGLAALTARRKSIPFMLSIFAGASLYFLAHPAIF